MRTFGVRLSPDLEEKLDQIFLFYNITSETDSDRFREFIKVLNGLPLSHFQTYNCYPDELIHPYFIAR